MEAPPARTVVEWAGWARAMFPGALHPPRDSSGLQAGQANGPPGQVTPGPWVGGQFSPAITASEQLPPGPRPSPGALTYVDGPAAVHCQLPAFENKHRLRQAGAGKPPLPPTDSLSP